MARFKELFSFSKRERPGIILLCLLLVLTAALPLIFRKHADPPAPSLLVRADSFFKAHEEGGVDRRSPEGYGHTRSPRDATSLFWFDPNTLSFADWEKLGLPDRSIRVIMHYLEKGGKFRRPDDLGRIWGLPPGEYARLRPYVRIRSLSQHDASGHSGESPPVERNRRDSVVRQPWSGAVSRRHKVIEVNQADSLQWLSLPGIGEKLTSRILRFREKLGGFCTVDQVGETWGLPDSTFQGIRPLLSLSTASMRKIPLNSAPEDILQQHPYIRYRLARVIIRYRQEHGPFSDVAELRNIALVTDDVYARLAPYCSVN